MTLNDVTLIGKKILVGVIITLIPFIIIFGGLWLIQRGLTNSNQVNQSYTVKTK